MRARLLFMRVFCANSHVIGNASGDVLRCGPRPATIDTMTDHPLRSPSPPTGDASTVADHWSAVINVHGCTLTQIEVAVLANQHDLDPHPFVKGRLVRRHPVYLVALDYRWLDAQGRPRPGMPCESDLHTLRQRYAARFDWISPDPPPSDGSHIRVAGITFVVEFDAAGEPTGRVIRV